MRLRVFALLVCIATMHGCAVSQEGVGVYIPSSDKKVAARLEQLKKNAAEHGSKAPGLIFIGKASAFRAIHERNAARVFKMYVKDAKSIDRSREPSMTEAQL